MGPCGRDTLGFAPRHVSVFSMSVGFVLIWTVALSGLLVNNAFELNANVGDTGTVLGALADGVTFTDCLAVRQFNAHQDMGRVVFALGQELGNLTALIRASA